MLSAKSSSGGRAFGRIATAMLACSVLSSPAMAQKSKDTLRVALVDPVFTVVSYDDPKPENSLLSNGVFDSLLCFDEKTASLKPLLARSWQKIDDRTYELKLRDDVKWHDGSQFTADDVVYTYNWIVDPKSKYRFASNFDWMEKVEKIDPFTVRVKAKYPTPLIPLRFAVNSHILPAKIHAKFANSAEFGRKSPVGTGPYRVVSVSPDKGVVLKKNEDYRHGNDCKPAARIGNVVALPIPDMQAQVAQLMTGGVDLLHVASHDQVELMRRNPNVAVTASQAITFHYMAIDSIGRSGNKPLQDMRVRRALIQAVNRKLLADTVVPGLEESKPWDMFCFKVQQGCAGARKPYPHDPAAAKKLLAEAGYPAGFALEITATPGSHDLAGAVAGELRKIGVKASVLQVTFGAYRQRQRAGKQQVLVGQWTSGGFPDVSSTAEFYFNGAARDYWRDPEILKLVPAALKETDEAKRRAMYAAIFDRAQERAYVLPLTTKPDVFVHAKDLAVEKGSMSTYGAELVGMSWK